MDFSREEPHSHIVSPTRVSIASMGVPCFKYSTLKSGEIRLLSPQSDVSGKLTWELKLVPLLSENDKSKAVSPSDYDPLSYTWGKPEDQAFPIICNDQTLTVRKNLYDALPYLARRLERAGSRPRQIWIDAVCINQSDVPEKVQQIGRMTEIYRLAREVVVWLRPGGGREHNDEAFALFPLLGQIGKKALKYQMDTSQPEPDFSVTAIPEASSPVWSILSDILFHNCGSCRSSL